MARRAGSKIHRLRDAMHRASESLDRDPGDSVLRAAWSKASADYYLALHPDDARWRRTEPSDDIPSVEEIRERSLVADAAHKAIPSWGRIDPRPGHRDAWSAQLAWALETWGEVFTDRFRAAEAAIKAGDRDGLEYCVRFLEADPWCHGSGYVKEGLIPAITKLELDGPTRGRLARVVLTVVDDTRPRREIRRYGNLARSVASTDLRAQLEGRLTHVDRQVRYNATRVLEALG